MKIQRRAFLRSAIGATAAAVFSSCSSRRLPVAANLPSPEGSGIEHVVVVMMENRSFDHLLGWLPTADGKQDGLSYMDKTGAVHSTYHLADDFTGCGYALDNSYQGARIEYNAGKMDGFLRSGNDTFAIGYYQEEDLTFFGAMARHYTTLDRYFCSFMGPTLPNRMFLHAAQTDRMDDSGGRCQLQTIWDRLAKAGVSGRAYGGGYILSLWGSEYANVTRTYEEYLSDAAAGQLPAVSFVDTGPYNPAIGGQDDHPPSDIRNGDAFLSQTYHALVNSPCWSKSVLIITFDEGGGFFDHVPPPRVVAPNTIDTDLIDGRALLGFRVPTVIVSPFSAGSPQFPSVNSTTFDHTSVLKLIEWRWNLPPLTARDASTEIGNLASVLDFANPRTQLPELPVVVGVGPSPCDGVGVS